MICIEHNPQLKRENDIWFFFYHNAPCNQLSEKYDVNSWTLLALVYSGLFNCSAHKEWAWFTLCYFCVIYLIHIPEEYLFGMGNHTIMMTSSNGNIFRVTGHLCGEFTGPGEIPTQRPVTRSFGVFFDLRLNKRLSKQWWGWWCETLSRPLWRHRNVVKVPVKLPWRIWIDWPLRFDYITITKPCSYLMR